MVFFSDLYWEEFFHVKLCVYFPIYDPNNLYLELELDTIFYSAPPIVHPASRLGNSGRRRFQICRRRPWRGRSVLSSAPVSVVASVRCPAHLRRLKQWCWSVSLSPYVPPCYLICISSVTTCQRNLIHEVLLGYCCQCFFFLSAWNPLERHTHVNEVSLAWENISSVKGLIIILCFFATYTYQITYAFLWHFFISDCNVD